MARPRMIVVAGPPGSGKTRYFPVTAFGVDSFNIIEQAELARKSGFATEMRFVATDSIAENVARVLQRAQAGGHGASEREIRAIHQASVANLRTAVAAFDRVRVYDSTPRWAPPRLVAVARGGGLVRRGPTPAWLDTALAASDE